MKGEFLRLKKPVNGEGFWERGLCEQGPKTGRGQPCKGTACAKAGGREGAWPGRGMKGERGQAEGTSRRVEGGEVRGVDWARSCSPGDTLGLDSEYSGGFWKVPSRNMICTILHFPLSLLVPGGEWSKGNKNGTESSSGRLEGGCSGEKQGDWHQGSVKEAGTSGWTQARFWRKC